MRKQRLEQYKMDDKDMGILAFFVFIAFIVLVVLVIDTNKQVKMQEQQKAVQSQTVGNGHGKQ